MSVTSPLVEWLNDPISLLFLALLAALAWLAVITRTAPAPAYRPRRR